MGPHAIDDFLKNIFAYRVLNCIFLTDLRTLQMVPFFLHNFPSLRNLKTQLILDMYTLLSLVKIKPLNIF